LIGRGSANATGMCGVIRRGRLRMPCMHAAFSWRKPLRDASSSLIWGALMEEPVAFAFDRALLA